ncbi:MAG: 6-pyruvoyl-tetrahydropterin synthase-related protein [Candidatus Omnitrophota bacterium]
MFRVKEDGVYLLLILAAAALMAWPLLSRGLIYGHDAITYFIKAVTVHQSWREGDFLSRWSPHINHGYGYPSLNFYSPLFSYIAAFFMFFFSLAAGFHAAIFLCLFLSGVTMYFFAREVWGNEGGLVASIAYLFAPYHILDIYVRGAVGEAASFIFFPMILLAFFRLSRTISVRDVLIGIVGVAGLILAHPLATFIFLPAAFVYALVLALFEGRFAWRNLLAMGFVFAGAFLLSAYFLLPAMLEQKFVHVEKFLGFDYRQHFIYLDQIFYSPWGFGDSAGRQSGMSFMAGMVQLALSLLVIVLGWRIIPVVKRSGLQVLFFGVLLIVAAFFTTGASSFYWEHIPKLPYVQFPWRFLLLITLALSFLSGGVVWLFTGISRRIALVCVCALLIGFNMAYCRPSRFIPVDQARSSAAFVEQLTPRETTGFLPMWVRNEAIAPYAQKLQVIQGEAQVTDQGGRSLDRLFHVSAAQPAALCFYSYYFPGWEVFVNGVATEIHPENPFGLIIFAVPAGDLSVRVRFGTTPVRQWGEGISLVMLGFIIFLLFFRKKIDRSLRT